MQVSNNEVHCMYKYRRCCVVTITFKISSLKHKLIARCRPFW